MARHQVSINDFDDETIFVSQFASSVGKGSRKSLDFVTTYNTHTDTATTIIIVTDRGHEFKFNKLTEAIEKYNECR